MMSDIQVEEKKGFSWLGFLFAPYYYGGYGKFKKGLVLSIIGFMPLTYIFIMIYGGIKAKKELPIGKQDFKWGAAIGLWLIHSIITGTVYSLSPQFQKDIAEFEQAVESTTLSDVSGVWRTDTGGDMVTIDLTKASKHLIINGQTIPVRVNNIDSDNGTISLGVNANNELVTWTIRQIFSNDNSFTLQLTLHEGTQDGLSFVRNLN